VQRNREKELPLWLLLTLKPSQVEKIKDPIDNTHCQSVINHNTNQQYQPPPMATPTTMATTTTTTPHAPPAKCHFNTLSGELRNRIYSYFFATLLTQTHQSTIDIREDHARLTRNAPKTRSALALTATSRQLRSETLALFWSNLSLRIVSGTLTAYSQPTDSVPGVHPMNRAHHINQDRAENLREWLQRSGVARFARFLRPAELDLGMWDPRAHRAEHQFRVLRLLGGDAQELTKALQQVLGRSRFVSDYNSDDGDEHEHEHDEGEDIVTTKKQQQQHPADFTLRFKVQVVPSTALGSICVANERKQALASIAELCEGRSAKVQDQFLKGILTTNGHFVLLQDMAMCRSLAELLVGYIVEEEEEEQEHVAGGAAKGQGGKRKLAVKKGQQGGGA
jgi:hypothetical protein